jgi:hypothetical protein
MHRELIYEAVVRFCADIVSARQVGDDCDLRAVRLKIQSVGVG